LENCQYENLVLVEAPSNDVWTRDHGAITVLENGQPILLDFVFNGWGLKFASNLDNQLSGNLQAQGIFADAPLIRMPIVLEGGSLDSDGQGTLLTTTECMLSPNRNRHLSQEEIENLLKEYFGAKRVLWIEHGFLAGDDTDSHIDMLARFTDPNTIAYTACSNPDDFHYEPLKKMEAQLQSFKTTSGEPYKLVPLELAPSLGKAGQRLPGSYTNFLIINGAVLVPQYAMPQDKLALEALKTCFPDREVVGLDCSLLITQGGSLHCATMQFPDSVPVVDVYTVVKD
jgi:agmatine deiminase